MVYRNSADVHVIPKH